MRITRADLNFEREALAKPFGFKGGYLSEIWQAAVKLESDTDHTAIGLGVQSVLWSDATVFAGHTESGGNALMLAMTEHALQCLKGQSIGDPISAIEEILPEVLAYGKKISAQPNLRTTFALNALVGIDFALWLLYARSNGIVSLDTLIPDTYRAPLSHRHQKVVSIPIVSYNTTDESLSELLDAGYFVLKVKLGAPGDQKEMLAQDKARLTHLHQMLQHHATPHTATGRIPYYLDANGRYESKDTLRALLDHADTIGALERIVILEEPFPESYEADVKDLGVCIAADESAHTDQDALARIEMGYGAIALKPIAKTLSMTLKIARLAHAHGIPCFCADLTVSPLLVEWNKNIAARLAPFPGVGLPMLEANGHQNYRDWQRMSTYLPEPHAPWISDREGVFYLNESFYQDQTLFTPSGHYASLFT